MSNLVLCLLMRPMFHEAAKFSWLVYFQGFAVFSFMVLLAVISCHSGVGCRSVLVLRHCIVCAHSFESGTCLGRAGFFGLPFF